MTPLNPEEFNTFAALLERLQYYGTTVNPVPEDQVGCVCVSFKCPTTGNQMTVACVEDLDYTLLDLFDGVRLAHSPEAKDGAYRELLSWLDSYKRGVHTLIQIPADYLQVVSPPATAH